MTAGGNGQREWMREQLRLAAEYFSVAPDGEPVFGWRDRTIGSRVMGHQGARWLRVSWADPQWAEGEYWTGNEDVANIVGVPKPTVLDLHEWGPRPIATGLNRVGLGHGAWRSELDQYHATRSVST
jgi:hypothetical protein